MTYLSFHLVFTLPPLLLLALFSWRDLVATRPLAGEMGRGTRFAWSALLVHVAIAFVYTTPWDNYLVARQVWGYGAERVLFTLGYVPFEEYLFFILQTLLTGTFLYFWARRLPWSEGRTPGSSVRFWGSLALFLLASVGLVALRWESGTYLGLILVWSAPVLGLQWAFGGDWLLARRSLVLPTIGVPTVYLWLADRYAIAEGIWWISEAKTTGLEVWGLPLEEAAFFLVTNMLVVFGLTLALHPGALGRARRLWESVGGAEGWWRVVFGLWALSMIPTPLVPQAFPLLAYVSTGLLALGVFGYSWSSYGVKTIWLFLVAFSFGLLVEALGSRTGFPFGAYGYHAPGPGLLGVPLLVPLGWWAFALIALAVSPRGAKLAVAPLVLVAWDLGLDPLMVAQGFWRFDAGGAYYGVPLSNFLGWYGAGLVLCFLLLKLESRLAEESGLALRLVFLAQAFLMSVGLVYFGLPWAGLVALLAMSLVSLPVWRKGLSHKRLRSSP